MTMSLRFIRNLSGSITDNTKVTYFIRPQIMGGHNVKMVLTDDETEKLFDLCKPGRFMKVY